MLILPFDSAFNNIKYSIQLVIMSENKVNMKVNEIMDICIVNYKEYLQIYVKSIKTIDEIEVYHEKAKSETLMKFLEFKEITKPDYDSKYKKILEQRLEDLYNGWRRYLEHTLAALEEEQEAKRQAEELKRQNQIKELENEAISLIQQIEIEKLNGMKAVADEKIYTQNKVDELNEKYREEQMRIIEREREEAEAKRKFFEMMNSLVVGVVIPILKEIRKK